MSQSDAKLAIKAQQMYSEAKEESDQQSALLERAAEMAARKALTHDHGSFWREYTINVLFVFGTIGVVGIIYWLLG